MPLIMVVHTFNPIPRVDYKMEKTALSTHASEILGGRLPFQTEVEVRASGWMLCFSDLQVEPQFLTLGFY